MINVSKKSFIVTIIKFNVCHLFSLHTVRGEGTWIITVVFPAYSGFNLSCNCYFDVISLLGKSSPLALGMQLLVWLILASLYQYIIWEAIFPYLVGPTVWLHNCLRAMSILFFVIPLSVNILIFFLLFFSHSTAHYQLHHFD